MTIKKNDQDWRRYYLSDDIIDIPLKNLSAQQLKDWCHKKIDDCQLNKKQYYNMAIVFKQCFWYACDIGAIPENTWERVKINTKKLKNEVKNRVEENQSQLP